LRRFSRPLSCYRTCLAEDMARRWGRFQRLRTTLYIFGSVHVLKPGTSWLDDDLRQKISSTTAIYLEVSPTSSSGCSLPGWS
jgi:uncharacterized protein YbaP (TraB family)